MNPFQIDNAEALRLFFQEELYVLPEDKLVQKPELEVMSPQIFSSDVAEVVSAAVSEGASSGPDNVLTVLESPEVNISYLGGNEQQILILLKDTLHKDLHAEERKLLMAILEAIKIKVNDYAIVFWDKHNQYNFKQFTGFLDSKKVLSFGMEANLLGLADLSFNRIHHVDGVEFILTSHLTDLKSDVSAKKVFWSQLKVLFP